MLSWNHVKFPEGKPVGLLANISYSTNCKSINSQTEFDVSEKKKKDSNLILNQSRY